VKLRGQISQGLVMPLSQYEGIIDASTAKVGDDLTELLGIEKYEEIIPDCLAGDVREFHWPVPKTDEERVQNDPQFYIDEMYNYPYYVTQKLDGSSATFSLIKANDGKIEYHVCSRNRSLQENPENSFWAISEKYSIRDILSKHYLSTGDMLTVQGELVGPGIQGNKLNLPEHRLYIFNIWDNETRTKFSFTEMSDFIFAYVGYNWEMVPVLEYGLEFTYETLDELLELAKGKYKLFFKEAIEKQDQEGIVIRSQEQTISFKVINNDFLLGAGNDE